MKVSGVNRLIFFKVFDRRIMLLGETHYSQNICKDTSISVMELYRKLIRETPEDECLDIFFEGSYKHCHLYQDDDPYLEKCRLYLFRKGNQHLRIHHTDVRHFPQKFNYGEVMLSVTWNNTLMEHIKTTVPREYLENAVRYLVAGTSTYKKYYWGFFDMIRQSIDFDAKFEIIREWEKDYFKAVNKQFKKFDTSLMDESTFKTILTIAFLNVVEQSTEDKNVTLVTLLHTIPAEVYTLARLFVKFDKQRKGTCPQDSNKNVVIHTGSTHSVLLEEFLRLAFGPALVNIVNKDTTDMCVDVSDFNFWSM